MISYAMVSRREFLANAAAVAACRPERLSVLQSADPYALIRSRSLMEDHRSRKDRDRITREQAQALWSDSRHWVLGIIYSCREDPRVIVRNRFWVGWTWNFGHPRVFPTMGTFTLFTLAPAAALFALGILYAPLLIGVTVAAITLLVVIARRIESGP